jgi:hypothetical protein
MVQENIQGTGRFNSKLILNLQLNMGVPFGGPEECNDPHCNEKCFRGKLISSSLVGKKKREQLSQERRIAGTQKDRPPPKSV